MRVGVGKDTSTSAENLTLFDVSTQLPASEPDSGVASERLAAIASRATQTREPLERARQLVLLASVVASTLEATIAEAREGGFSWRQIAARVDVPYQTLHRRYRASERDRC